MTTCVYDGRRKKQPLNTVTKVFVKLKNRRVNVSLFRDGNILIKATVYSGNRLKTVTTMAVSEETADAVLFGITEVRKLKEGNKEGFKMGAKDE